MQGIQTGLVTVCLQDVDSEVLRILLLVRGLRLVFLIAMALVALMLVLVLLLVLLLTVSPLEY